MMTLTATVNQQEPFNPLKPCLPANATVRALSALKTVTWLCAIRNLASRIPTKTRDDDADKMFNAKLPLTKAFSLFTMMAYGPRLPIEKARDESHRRIPLRSAAPYSLSMESLETILAADRDELTAYELGLTKNAQQIFKYTLPGLLGNYMNERVFTPRDVYPSDDVKMHLGLTGAHAQMSFMNL